MGPELKRLKTGLMLCFEFYSHSWLPSKNVTSLLEPLRRRYWYSAAYLWQFDPGLEKLKYLLRTATSRSELRKRQKAVGFDFGSEGEKLRIGEWHLGLP